MSFVSVTPKIEIENNRVIEINHLGRFYVLGSPKFSTLKVTDFLDPNREGWIIVDETISFSSNPYELNRVFKMTEDKRLIATLFKSEEMAETVCYACNRIRI
jgi:hypothetical protein